MNRKAVVIGGGYGGLASAALLARDGWKVTLLEKNSTLGGRARSWEIQGYTFDLGPSWYLMPEVFERFFSLFDVKREDYYSLRPLDPYYKVFFNEGESSVLTGDERQHEALFDSFQPGGGEALQRYKEQASYKYKVAMEEFLYRDYKRVSEFFNRKLMSEGLKLGVFKKLDKFVSQYVQDRRAKQILEYAMVFLGTDPADAPALYSIMSHVDLELGVFFPEKGMAGVAQGMAALCRQLGVTLVTDAEVTSITGSKDRADRVITADGTTYEADVVVASGDYHHMETQLLSSEHRTYSRRYWDSRVLAPSMFIAYLGIGRKLQGLEHHNLYFKEHWTDHFKTIFQTPSWPGDPCFYLSCISKTDSSSAPEGCENVFLLVPTAPGLEDSDRQREDYLNHVLAHVKRITGEDLTKDVEVQRIFTQRDFITDYHAFKGTALGLSHTLRQTAVFRPASRSRHLKNLFYAGQYTHPGVGVPMVLIAAENVTGEIRKIYGAPTA